MELKLKKMYLHAKKYFKRKIKLLNKDIRKYKLKKSDLIISYYTLQFIFHQ